VPGADGRAGKTIALVAILSKREASAIATASRQYGDGPAVLAERLQLHRPPGQYLLENQLGVLIGANTTG
jgi:hypothetical protein